MVDSARSARIGSRESRPAAIVPTSSRSPAVVISGSLRQLTKRVPSPAMSNELLLIAGVGIGLGLLALVLALAAFRGDDWHHEDHGSGREDDGGAGL